MINKKILNATQINTDGIEFKSLLERIVYKTLLEHDINAEYEKRTFSFVPKLRPSIPFYNRVAKTFSIDMKPLRPITYTPDFTFEYNGILIIIEAKGFENDVFPIKRNLFRRYLEEQNTPAMFFEVRTKRELLEALNIIKMENTYIQNIRKLINNLPEKDIPLAIKLLEKRDWDNLIDLVNSDVKKAEKKNIDNEEGVVDDTLPYLYNLQSLIEDNLCTND